MDFKEKLNEVLSSRLSERDVSLTVSMEKIFQEMSDRGIYSSGITIRGIVEAIAKEIKVSCREIEKISIQVHRLFPSTKLSIVISAATSFFHQRFQALEKLKLSRLSGVLSELKLSPDIPNIDLSDLKTQLETKLIFNIESYFAMNKPLAKTTETEQRKEATAMSPVFATSKNVWNEIEKDYDISKRAFGKKINFVSDAFKRKVIFRDVEQAYLLANHGFSKPAVIIAGGVIEELLRLYLDAKGHKPQKDNFDSYIKICEDKGLLKSAINRLTDSVRHFRNFVHIQKENSPKATISKATAKGAVSSIFTIVNDLQ
jgi:hypothetical protein